MCLSWMENRMNTPIRNQNGTLSALGPCFFAVQPGSLNSQNMLPLLTWVALEQCTPLHICTGVARALQGERELFIFVASALALFTSQYIATIVCLVSPLAQLRNIKESHHISELEDSQVLARTSIQRRLVLFSASKLTSSTIITF